MDILEKLKNQQVYVRSLKLLNGLGLTNEQSLVFLTVLLNPNSTVLQISRLSGIKRTTVYRICDELTKQGFLIRNAKWRTTKYEAISFENLFNKIQDVEDSINSIKKIYAKLNPVFHDFERQNKNEIKVIHYLGKEEVRQLVWNAVKAKTIIKSFGYRTLAEPLGKKFIVHWWNELARLNIKTYMITNPGMQRLKNNVDAHLSIKYIKPVNSLMKIRESPTSIIKITQETFIYNDIYAIVQWYGNQIFGVKIYNKFVADQERAVFDVLWRIAGGK